MNITITVTVTIKRQNPARNCFLKFGESSPLSGTGAGLPYWSTGTTEVLDVWVQPFIWITPFSSALLYANDVATLVSLQHWQNTAQSFRRGPNEHDVTTDWIATKIAIINRAVYS